MATPHKHAELIKAWADGARIEWRFSVHDIWMDVEHAGPYWNNDACVFRIKPEPKPDIVECRRVVIVGRPNKSRYMTWFEDNPNVQIVFDGETEILKSISML